MSGSSTTSETPAFDASSDFYAEHKRRLETASCDGTEDSARQQSQLLRDTYATAQALLGQADAIKLRSLAAAYELADTLADSLSPTRGADSPLTERMLKDRDRRFAWHLRSLMGELSFIARETDITLRNRAYDAYELVTNYSEWIDAIAAGEVEFRHARELLKNVRALERKEALALSERGLEYAREHSVRETSRFLEQELAKLTAEDFEGACKRERAERNVYVKPARHGMAYLIAYLPIEQATAIKEILTRQARALREDAEREAVECASLDGFLPDDRTTAQIRADVFAETMLTATPTSILESETAGASRITATINVTVPVLSLLSERIDGSDPALLNGIAPMSFEEARQLAATAPALQRVLTDPITGHTLCVDHYPPDESQRRFLRVRDAICRFPGCSRPAAGSEIDHTIPYSEGGPTNIENLAHLCKAHHVQKHHAGWGVKQLGRGVLEFTTPLGYRATTSPSPTGPRFRPTGEPATPANRASEPAPF